jgi:AraC family transcriptional regulator
MRVTWTPGQLSADTPRVSKVPGLTCWETAYAPDQDRPAHAHLNTSINPVLQGALAESCNGRSLTIASGTVFFIPAGQVHANRILGAGARCFEMRLDPRWLQRLEGCSSALAAPAYLPGGPLSGLALRLCHEARQTDAASALVMEGLALELLGEIARCRTPASGRRPPRWLLQARDLLRERFAESLTLEEIAGAVGVHPVHLATAFREQYGRTVGDTVRRLPIEFACRAIARTQTPLTEIALDAGFANQSHFTRVFKRLTGITPAGYRRAFSSTEV